MIKANPDLIQKLTPLSLPFLNSQMCLSVIPEIVSNVKLPLQSPNVSADLHFHLIPQKNE